MIREGGCDTLALGLHIGLRSLQSKRITECLSIRFIGTQGEYMESVLHWDWVMGLCGKGAGPQSQCAFTSGTNMALPQEAHEGRHRLRRGLGNPRMGLIDESLLASDRRTVILDPCRGLSMSMQRSTLILMHMKGLHLLQSETILCATYLRCGLTTCFEIAEGVRGGSCFG